MPAFFRHEIIIDVPLSLNEPVGLKYSNFVDNLTSRLFDRLFNEIVGVFPSPNEIKSSEVIGRGISIEFTTVFDLSKDAYFTSSGDLHFLQIMI